MRLRLSSANTVFSLKIGAVAAFFCLRLPLRPAGAKKSSWDIVPGIRRDWDGTDGKKPIFTYLRRPSSVDRLPVLTHYLLPDTGHNSTATGAPVFFYMYFA